MPRTSARRARIVPWTVLLLYLGAIFYVSSKSQDDLPSLGFALSDKVVHLKVYGLLGLLAAWSLRRTWPGLRRGSVVAIVFLAGTLYGLSDEMHQSFVPGRAAEVGDLIADALGSGLGALAFFVAAPALARLRRSRRDAATGQPAAETPPEGPAAPPEVLSATRSTRRS